MLKKCLFFCAIFLLLVSCEKIFINGDLDGMWRLERVESADRVEYPDSIFYSFQRHLVMLGIYSETKYPVNWYMGCFEFTGDSLVMDNFYRYPGTDGVRIPEELASLYIFDDVTRYGVMHLSDEMFVISTDSIQCVFRKW
jgi:hypothetical protein